MVAQNSEPYVLGVIRSALAELDKGEIPLSRIVQKVIRVASLLNDHEHVVRFRLEIVENANRAKIHALVDELVNCFDPSVFQFKRLEMLTDFYAERSATFSNMAKPKEQEAALFLSLRALEQSKELNHDLLRQNTQARNSFDYRVVYSAADRTEADEQAAMWRTNLRDHEAIINRIRENMHHYLIDAERTVIVAANAAPPPQEGRSVDADAPSNVDKRKVFVVYGQDEEMRRSMFSFLRAAGLDPMEWNEIVQLTIEAKGQASPYVGDILDVGMSVARAVVVVFTGDETAKLRLDLMPPGKKKRARVEYQPRPNVLIEAGMALGKYPERTVLVEVGNIRSMTDLVGRHVIRMVNTEERRKELMNRLYTAGCAVRYDRNDWAKEGKFPEP